ncbi:MAG: YitT family protein [Cellulosilyticum sp.]|nr:YitT family protein [Cellulosilyticum sp.]
MRKILISKKEFLMILLGTTILALGINWFTSPLGLVTGGLSGITIIVKSLSEEILGFGIPLWITNLVLNIPLFVISIRQRGFEFAKKSLWGVGLLTLALWYTEFIPNLLDVQGDLLLGGIFGGAILGTGVGIVLKAGGTTGGTDMLATIIQYKHKSFPISKLILALDAAIILCGMLVFGSTKAMYAIIAVFMSSKMISWVLEGMNNAKAAFILSEHSQEIAEAIMHKLPRGVTGIKAQGMYTKQDKDMLYVVVSQKEITRLRDMVKAIDSNAFITIADVREVLGQGFIEDNNTLA